ncbi:MAG: Ig-like domain-containing protein [Desulfuromonadaceae bacterium]|nr:Ig-like domain-containing protein [Desulfuromonadaceae bacterium]
MKKNVINVVLGIFVAVAFGLAGCGGGSGGGGTPASNNTALLTAITITPTSPNIATGASLQFSATGTYSDNSTQNLTASVTWSSSDTSKANISNAGMANTIAAGTSTIKAMLGSISGTSTLTISGDTAPVISSQPANITVPISQAAQFSVSASGAAPLGYQWYQNGVAIANATESIFQIQSVKLSDNQSEYYVSVSNAGGSVSSSTVTLSVTPPAPISAPVGLKVESSSYLNAKTLNLGPKIIPIQYWAFSYALADFFQTGEYSLFLATQNYNVNDPTTFGNYGDLYFFKNVNGTWVDNTSQLLSDTTGCLHPRKAIVADFNGDGKPDIFVACHGLDTATPPGEASKYLLSQPDGKYVVKTLPFVGFSHSASAAELNAKGYADVVVSAGNYDPIKSPYFLMNNGDGTFTVDNSRIPANEFIIPNNTGHKTNNTVELIDFNVSGHYDLFVAGNEPNTATLWPEGDIATTIFPNDGKNRFISTTPIRLPGDNDFSGAIDIVFQNNAIYLLRTINVWSLPNYYQGMRVQKISYPSLVSSIIYTHTGPYTTVHYPWDVWFPWIVPYNGKIIADNAFFPVSLDP